MYPVCIPMVYSKSRSWNKNIYRFHEVLLTDCRQWTQLLSPFPVLNPGPGIIRLSVKTVFYCGRTPQKGNYSFFFRERNSAKGGGQQKVTTERHKCLSTPLPPKIVYYLDGYSITTQLNIPHNFMYLGI